MITAVLTDVGRAAMAASLAAQSIHYAWGEGDAAWDDDPNASAVNLKAETALTAELGRRPAITGYAEPDPDGDISMPVGLNADGTVRMNRYKQVTGPSPWLYLRVTFDFEDAPRNVIREVGVFVGTVVKDDVPPGKKYVVPDELKNPGMLLSIQRRVPPIHRSESVRQAFDFILPI